jgi:hypothetical protein
MVALPDMISSGLKFVVLGSVSLADWISQRALGMRKGPWGGAKPKRND